MGTAAGPHVVDLPKPGAAEAACTRPAPHSTVPHQPLCRYWEGKGFGVILTARVLNLLALAFTGAHGSRCRGEVADCCCCRRLCKMRWALSTAAAPFQHHPGSLLTSLPQSPPVAAGMSALLLLYVNWGALQAECLRKDTCDIWEASLLLSGCRLLLSGSAMRWSCSCRSSSTGAGRRACCSMDAGCCSALGCSGRALADLAARVRDSRSGQPPVSRLLLLLVVPPARSRLHGSPAAVGHTAIACRRCHLSAGGHPAAPAGGRPHSLDRPGGGLSHPVCRLLAGGAGACACGQLAGMCSQLMPFSAHAHVQLATLPTRLPIAWPASLSRAYHPIPPTKYPTQIPP